MSEPHRDSDPAHDNTTGSGRLASNVMHFARILRAAGMPVGTGQIMEALRALERIDMTRRDEFTYALQAVLLSDHRQRELFMEAFRLFWRNPGGMEAIMAALLPKIEVREQRTRRAGARRLADALRPYHARPTREQASDKEKIEFDAVMTSAADEVLRRKDFAQMSADEIRQARKLVAGLRLPIAEVATRRFRPDVHGARVDLRASFRASLRAGGSSIPLRWRSRQRRPPPLVVLCDISGSMERYSHMLLHFLHALTGTRERVHSFVFGTRLTNITRYMRQRDIDVALARIGQAVEDFAGGTRIGLCLGQFNGEWSRRVLGQGAVVLLITDGLERGTMSEEPDEFARRLERVMDRLGKSCRRLIWLNPLLRYDAFEAKARGIRAMLPYVDEFRPIHNLRSFEDLALALS